MKWKSQLLLLTLLLAVPMVFAGGQAIPHPLATLLCMRPCSCRYSTTTTSTSLQTTSKRSSTRQKSRKAHTLPCVSNESAFMHVTDTQLIQLRAGSLGGITGSPVPPADAIINQGGKDLTTSGTRLTQPLTTLLKIRWKTTWREPSGRPHNRKRKEP